MYTHSDSVAKMCHTWIISAYDICSSQIMMTITIVTMAGIAGKVVTERRVHNNEPHPSLTACTEYIVQQQLNVYFLQVFFFSSPGLKPLYVLVEVLICCRRNCHRTITADMLLWRSMQSSGQHSNGWIWVIWNSQALQHAISHTHSSPPPSHIQLQDQA